KSYICSRLPQVQPSLVSFTRLTGAEAARVHIANRWRGGDVAVRGASEVIRAHRTFACQLAPAFRSPIRDRFILGAWARIETPCMAESRCTARPLDSFPSPRARNWFSSQARCCAKISVGGVGCPRDGHAGTVLNFAGSSEKVGMIS